MPPLRFCVKCGASYPSDDTIGKCDQQNADGRCGGEVPSFRVPDAKCLKCNDTGAVQINDPRDPQPENKPCPAGCKPRKGSR